MPASPSPTTSPTPPTAVVMTGRPVAIASSATNDDMSARVGSTKTSLSAYSRRKVGSLAPSPLKTCTPGGSSSIGPRVDDVECRPTLEGAAEDLQHHITTLPFEVATDEEQTDRIARCTFRYRLDLPQLEVDTRVDHLDPLALHAAVLLRGSAPPTPTTARAARPVG